MQLFSDTPIFHGLALEILSTAPSTEAGRVARIRMSGFSIDADIPVVESRHVQETLPLEGVVLTKGWDRWRK